MPRVCKTGRGRCKWTTGATPPGGGVTLTPSGPIAATSNGQVFQNLDITSSGAQAVYVNGFTDVQLKSCKIRHSAGYGVQLNGAHRFLGEDLDIEYTGGPASGANQDENRNNVQGDFSDDVRLNRIRMRKGSSGILLNYCLRPWCSFLEGYDFRGPFPRGQLIQFGRCHNGLIEDFSSISTPSTSWDEDNVNMYLSSNVTIRRGLLDGNNSPAGWGIIFEQHDEGATGGLVEDVDTIRMGNGGAAAYSVGFNITFRRTRHRENICSDQGRGAPLSGALMWGGGPGSTGLRIEDSRYYLPCNAGNIIWDSASFDVIETTQGDYTQRPPIVLTMPWE